MPREVYGVQQMDMDEVVETILASVRAILEARGCDIRDSETGKIVTREVSRRIANHAASPIWLQMEYLHTKVER